MFGLMEKALKIFMMISSSRQAIGLFGQVNCQSTVLGK